MIGALNAASNITGVLTDTNAFSALLHKYNALVFWDYATAGEPYSCTYMYVYVYIYPIMYGPLPTHYHNDVIELPPVISPCTAPYAKIDMNPVVVT